MHVYEFQDELKKAVSARGNRHSYSDDFDDDDYEDGKDGDDDGRFYNAMFIKNMFTVLYTQSYRPYLESGCLFS